jgi:hypothetical protein
VSSTSNTCGQPSNAGRVGSGRLSESRSQSKASVGAYKSVLTVRERSDAQTRKRGPLCSQCLDRRIGVVGAGLESFDKHHKTDVFLDELSGNGLMLAESYVGLMTKVSNLAPENLLEEYAALNDCAFNDVDGEPAAVERIVSMLRRQVETVNAVLRKVTRRCSPSF